MMIETDSKTGIKLLEADRDKPSTDDSPGD